MGLGICGMHYTGMGAILIQPGIEYDPELPRRRWLSR